MKKIFTLIACLTMAVSAFAQSWFPNENTVVEANQTYVDDEIITLSSSYAGTLKTNSVTIAGTDFTHYIQVRADAAPTTDVPFGTEKSGSTTLVISTKKDVEVTFFYRRQAKDDDFVNNDGKDLKVFNHSTAAILDGVLTVDSKNEAGDYAFVTKVYQLEANAKYTIWARGTTINFYGLKYASETANTPTFDFLNNNGGWETCTFDNMDSYALPTITSGDISLTGIQGDASQPVRYWDNGEKYLQVNLGSSLKFTVPEGRSIRSITAEMRTKSFEFTANVGTFENNQWTGNATEVTLTNNASNCTIYSLTVVTDVADAETETPSVDAEVVEVENISAFNALEVGTIAKLTLKDVQVNGFDNIFNTLYVEDATGATQLVGMPINASTGNILNGTIIGMKAYDESVFAHQMKSYESSTAETVIVTDGNLKSTNLTIAEASKEEHVSQLVKLSNVKIEKIGRFWYAIDGDEQIQIYDGLGVFDYGYEGYPAKAESITGIVYYNVVRWAIMPISADAIVAAPATTTFDFTDGSLFEPGETMTDVKGYIYNQTFTVDNVNLQITCGSAASRIYKDAKRGTCLAMYKDYSTLTFTAPEGKAITKIEFTFAGNGNLNLTPSCGTLVGTVWEGNAEGVRFLNNATPYFSNIVVTLAEKNSDSQVLQPIEYVECADIAEFNALEAGTYAKVALTDAEVIGVSADGYTTVWVQDATGGAWLQYTSLNSNLKAKTKLNGFIYTIKRATAGNVQMKETEDTPKSEFTVTDITGDYTMVEGSLTEVNIPANIGRVVKIENANVVFTTVTEKAQNGTLTQGDATIAINNGIETANQQLHLLEGLQQDVVMENVTVVGILVATSATDASKTQILPISITSVADAIDTVVKNEEKDAVIYNLQGIKLPRLQKGLNIVNGKKVMLQ